MLRNLAMSKPGGSVAVGAATAGSVLAGAVSDAAGVPDAAGVGDAGVVEGLTAGTSSSWIGAVDGPRGGASSTISPGVSPLRM
jgi:hypothetical protein